MPLPNGQPTPEEQAAFDSAFKEFTASTTKASPINSIKEQEIDANIDNIFGSEYQSEDEKEFNRVLELRSTNKQGVSMLRIRNHLVKEWFALFRASKWVTDMQFGAIICVIKDDAENEEIRKTAQMYYTFMENAANMIKRPDSNDDFWRYMNRIRLRWEKEVKIDWKQIILKEIPKMPHPHSSESLWGKSPSRYEFDLDDNIK